MRVLVLGPPRTGTTSLYDTLVALDYTVYAGMKHDRAQPHYPAWNTLLDAKTAGLEIPLAELEKILAPYDAVTGWPATCFARELLQAYPNAKVILNMRDVDAWLDSMQRTLLVAFGWPSWQFVIPLSGGMVADFYGCVRRCIDLWQGGNREEMRRVYLEHCQYIRNAVSTEKLLEVELGRYGWEEICAFLSKSMPVGVQYPWTAEGKSIMRTPQRLWWLALRRAVTRTVLVSGFVGLMLILIWNKTIHKEL